MYDDDRVSSITHNWAGVINLLLEQQAYPTVLFYESLERGEEDRYRRSLAFRDLATDFSILSNL